MVYHQIVHTPDQLAGYSPETPQPVANLEVISGDVPELCPLDMNRIYDTLRDPAKSRVRSARSLQYETNIHFSHVLEALDDPAVARPVNTEDRKHHRRYTAADTEKLYTEMTRREKFLCNALSLSKYYLSFY